MDFQDPTGPKDTQLLPYLNAEPIKDIPIEKVLPYEGEGSTSFMSKYDQEKIEYLTTLGINIPEALKQDRALLMTTFVVTGNILALREIAETEDDNTFMQILEDRNRILEEHRVDPFNQRRILSTGQRVEDVVKNLGFSSNPSQQVSQEELKDLCDTVLAWLNN